MELKTGHVLGAGLVLTLAFIGAIVWMAIALPAPQDATDWWTAAGGVVTALATIGLVVVTGLLWVVTRNAAAATADSASAAQRAANVAERAAESAEKAHRAAQDTAKRQLRAYLAVDPSVRIQISTSRKVTFEFDARNTGCTPAYKFFIASQIVLAGKDAEDFRFVPFERIERGHESTLGPGRSETCEPVWTSITLSEDEFRAYEAGDKEIVVSGCLFYHDAFGDKQHTNFSCRFFKVDGVEHSHWTGVGNDSS